MLKRSIMLLLFILPLLLFSGCAKESITLDSKILSTGTDTYFGYLKIPAIDFNQGFFNYDSTLNDVDKNIMLIPTGIRETYLIAAHSGHGKLAYFNDLRDLVIGDDIYLEFKDKKYHYEVTKIRRDVKNGTVSIPDESNMLILTTCDQIVKGYQLTIESRLLDE